MSNDSKAIIIDEKDNVATLLCDGAKKGSTMQVQIGEKEVQVEMRDNVEFGHKIALHDIKKGEPIFKYGEIIGQAARDIAKGEHVHIHNVDSCRGLAEEK